KHALSFYAELASRAGVKSSDDCMEDLFKNQKNPAPQKISEALWKHCLASHHGFQLGSELLKILPKIGKISQFLELNIDEKLNAIVPDLFSNPDSIHRLVKALNPPPKAKSDEIVSPMGGMFYSREAPHLPQMVQAGDHFEVGQPLFIIEVMKMFNKITAPFSGTIVESYLADSDGKIITKGQAIFKVKPDEMIQEETEEEILKRKKQVSLGLI
ncbi:MAG: acetyl-CoA carboxylase biotin carboxyl carrier protein subunit, partial [Deltaproteobacteria bacterium]|nr:acetyl-CoA carboxylase biotin carboxyl carrier protein subunit [Deltaproteobacteria bacterium]